VLQVERQKCIDLRVAGLVGTWKADAARELSGSAASDADVCAGHVELGATGAVGRVESYLHQYDRSKGFGLRRNLPMSSARMM
jgi:hypothetical protein